MNQVSATAACCGEQASHEELLGRLDGVLEEYRGKPGALIPVLQIAQGIFGYLPEDVLKRVALKMGKSYSEVAGVVGFYSYFSTVPRGKHLVRVCLGTACYVRGGKLVLEGLKQELGIEVGSTTADGQFSLEVARCFGACGLAPTIMIDEDVLKRVALKLGKSYSEVAGVVGFYSFFSTVPRGKHLVRVCLGTACYVRGGKLVLEGLKQELGIEVGSTTADGQFSLEVARCFGACGLAPTIMIDEDVHQRVKPLRLRAILEQYANGKSPAKKAGAAKKPGTQKAAGAPGGRGKRIAARKPVARAKPVRSAVKSVARAKPVRSAAKSVARAKPVRSATAQRGAKR